MRVLVTGGAGFIGSHIVEHHLAKGDQVHVVDDLSTGNKDNITRHEGNHDFTFSQADLLIWDNIVEAAMWADRIYHMAAIVGVFKVLEDPVRVMAVTVAATERLLRAAIEKWHRPRVVLASSSEVYGHNPRCDLGEDLNEEMDLSFPSNGSLRWNYAIGKLANEAMGSSFARQHELPVTVVRFFNTVGPRQLGRYGMVVPRFVRQAVRNEPMTVFGEGVQRRCFTDVRDTVKVLDKLTENTPGEGHIYNVGNTRDISILELAELVRERAGSSSEIQFVPYEKAYGAEFTEIYKRKPNIEKLRKATGYEFHYTLEDTLDDLIAMERARMEQQDNN